MAINTTFLVPCAQDRAVLAVQDTVSQLGWNVLEASTTRFVVETPGLSKLQVANFPRLTVELASVPEGTEIRASITALLGTFGAKKPLTGYLGRFVNDLSLRVQTQSIAINPTVALGDGQGPRATDGALSPSVDRVARLVALKNLLDSGALTDDEFRREKERLLNEA